jgi:predicted cupin superfamily sugar epimerase
MNAAAKKIIAQFGLAPLPREGGFFRRTWTSRARLADGRAAGSAIWFLLTPENFSALHRLQAEELWYFQAGDPVEHVQLDPAEGAVRVTVLGVPGRGRVPQLVVPGGVWQGARIRAGARPRGWALLGCTLAPAWDEREFELGRRKSLLGKFPGERGRITALTR